jgi:hypothetical protein
MSDNRKELLTITMTHEEWDAALHYGFSYNAAIERVARKKLYDQVDEGYEERKAAAKAEFAGKVPQLTELRKKRIGKEVRRLVAEFEAGKLEVDHLGSPATIVGPYSVSVTPRTVDGSPALHFTFVRGIWFGHKEYPLPQEDRMWFVKLVHEVTGQEGHFWSERQAPWVSVMWTPTRTRRDDDAA